MKPKLIVTFSRYSEAEFQSKVRTIISKLTSNINYPEPWAAQVSSLAQISDSLNKYQKFHADSIDRDTRIIRSRNESRVSLTEMLQNLAPYLELIAQGDAKILESTGYDLRREFARGGPSTELLSAPSDFRVAHGRISGTLVVHMSRLAGAASYEVETSQGDGSAAGDWKHAATAASGTRILIPSLTVGESYWVRARAVGNSGGGLWTEPIRMMVV
jgi:hypothetical protein